MVDRTTDDRSMGDAFRSATRQSREEQLAQIEAYLGHMAAQGYDRIKGPILQAVKAIALPGRRDEILDILRKFRPIASGEEGTVFYGHFPRCREPRCHSQHPGLRKLGGAVPAHARYALPAVHRSDHDPVGAGITRIFLRQLPVPSRPAESRCRSMNHRRDCASNR